MIKAEVIIIGGGPAGAGCAWELKSLGRQAIILDKESFPRSKQCAGWITPTVLRDLDVQPRDYPYGMLTMQKLEINAFGKRFFFPTLQYSIRRDEFDSWLLGRTGATVFTHRVRDIRKHGGSYIIDGAFACKHLVGAGGTFCPVHAAFFRDKRPRSPESLILTLEKELPHNEKDRMSRLWFFEQGLPGYAWCIPMDGGYINTGIGGNYSRMKKKNMSIRSHWKSFAEKLKDFSFEARQDLSPRGYAYYTRKDTGPVTLKNAYLVGDAAGLATIDMGEGIGPAVRSGILAARSIATGKPYALGPVSRFSLRDILLPGRA